MTSTLVIVAVSTALGLLAHAMVSGRIRRAACARRRLRQLRRTQTQRAALAEQAQHRERVIRFAQLQLPHLYSERERLEQRIAYVTTRFISDGDDERARLAVVLRQIADAEAVTGEA